jgi:hypothetical protein
MRTVDDLCRFSGLAPRQDPDSGFGVDADALFLAEVFEGVTFFNPEKNRGNFVALKMKTH